MSFVSPPDSPSIPVKGGKINGDEVAKIFDSKLSPYLDKVKEVKTALNDHYREIDNTVKDKLDSLPTHQEVDEKVKDAIGSLQANHLADMKSKLGSKIESAIQDLHEIMISNVHTIRAELDKIKDDIKDEVKKLHDRIRESEDQLHADMDQGDLGVKEESNAKLVGLTASIAHDISNQSQSIIGLQAGIDDSHDVLADHIQDIHASINSLTNIADGHSKQIEELSKPPEANPQLQGMANEVQKVADSHNSLASYVELKEKELKQLMLNIKSELMNDLEHKLNSHTVEILKLFNKAPSK